MWGPEVTTSVVEFGDSVHVWQVNACTGELVGVGEKS